MSKITCYIPIPVSSGELPENNTYYLVLVEPDRFNKSNVDCRFSFNGMWMQLPSDPRITTHWLKETIIDILEVGDKTKYGIIEEFVEKDGVKMMRSKNPYGTWPIEPA